MNILIIDDDSDFIKLIRLILKSHLKKANLTVYDVNNLGIPGEDYGWKEFDLVLLDYNLGNNENGIEWLRKFRKYENIPPIIMLTGEGDEYVAVNAIRNGANDYLNKDDVYPDSIVKAIIGANPKIKQHKTESVTKSSVFNTSELEETFPSMEFADKDGFIDISVGYKFVSKIAEGGMSRVYLAERLSDKQTMVLKILDLSTNVDEVLVTRFVQEAEMLSELKSPFVVTVFDYGIANDYAFLAIEFFPRGDLKQRMEQKLNTEIALAYMNHITYGIDAIHSIGIAHRDLKPANIMFRGDDSLAIADFGIAKKLNTAFDITTVGVILGTPNYMSPEQASGSKIDQSTDIYNAGLIFFELLSGKKPFKGKTPAEIIYKHKYAPIPDLPKKYAQFQKIICKTLAKEPENRYDSKQLITAIETAMV